MSGEPRTERRLTTILAADVAGYSRLTGADEERTLARLKALRHELIDPAIAAARGRVVKTMGDGILIEFPSAVDAVRCAIDVQRKNMWQRPLNRLGLEERAKERRHPWPRIVFPPRVRLGSSAPLASRA